MSDQVVTLRIVGENGKLVAAVKTSKAELGSLASNAETTGKRGGKGLEELGKGAKKSERDIKAASGSIKSLTEDAKRYGTIAGLAITAAAGIAASVAGIYLRNSIESEKVQSQLVSRIKDTAGAAGRSLAQLNAEAAKLQSQTIFDDETVGNAQAMLLTFKNIQGMRFDQATDTVLDMSTAMGTDAVGSAVQLGKALNDPIDGVAALAKIGVKFTDDQKKVIQVLVETGNVAGAQKVILDELAGQMGTAAEAARDTLGGAMTALKNSADNLLEGDSGSGGLTGTRQGVESLIEQLNDPDLKTGVDSTVEGLLKIAGAALQVIGMLGNAGSALAEFFAANDRKSAASLLNKQNELETKLFVEERAANSVLGRAPAAIRNSLGIGADSIKAEIAEIEALRAKQRKATQDQQAASLAAAAVADSVRVGRGPDVLVTGGLTNKERDDAAKAAAKLAEQTEKAAARARAELAKFRDELERSEAQLAGPLAVAQVEHAQRLADLADRLKAGTFGQQEFDRAKAVSEAQLRRTVDAIAREQDVLGRVQADYEELIYLSGLSTQARRVEEEVIRAVNDAIDAGKPLRDDEVEHLRAFIDQSQRVVEVSEAHQAAAEDYQRNWQGAISSVAGAMGDFFASGLRDSKSFTEGLKDIFKRWFSNVIAMFADGALKRAFGGVAKSVSGWLSNMGSGASSGSGGGMWSSLLSSATGGGGSGAGWMSALGKAYSGFTSGFSAAGASGSGTWGSIISGFSSAVSAFTGSLGAASTATGAYSSIIGGLASTYGGVGVAGAAAGGAGATGMGAIAGVMKVLAAVPVWGWIVAAIVAGVAGSVVAYKNG